MKIVVPVFSSLILIFLLPKVLIINRPIDSRTTQSIQTVPATALIATGDVTPLVLLRNENPGAQPVFTTMPSGESWNFGDRSITQLQWPSDGVRIENPK